MSVRNATTAAIAAIGVLALAACSQSPAAGEPAATTKQTITVYAAASLTKTFTQLGKDYQEQHPGSIVRLTFGGSADLLTQLQNGAPGDVLATADEATMTKAVNAKLNGGEPEIFATNRLTIATAPAIPSRSPHSPIWTRSVWSPAHPRCPAAMPPGRSPARPG
nr:molybdate ABC transporter substrate-binding protein [Enemella evansiae]